ncbi:MAG: hypothetical protein NVSMB5_03200 [Candidatus Velthaea sp.]
MEWSFDAADIQSAARTRSSFRTLLREAASDESDLHAADVIYGELVGNAVRHAGGQIDISLVWLEHGAALRVRDHGTGFRHTGIRIPDDDSESGRGLFLASKLTNDFVHVARCATGGAELTVVLPVWQRMETAQGR